MEKRERYKRLLIFAVSAVIMAVQTGVFTYTWYNSYANTGANYFVRGNYLLILQYALMLFLFYKVFGGFKVGQLRILGMLYTQMLSILCVNAITYIEISLIGRWGFMENVVPIIKMTIVDMYVVVIWVVLARILYVKVFPPRKLLVVYGNYDPHSLIQKLALRDDKYVIQEAISCDEGIRKIKSKISKYRGVLLTDLPAELRNELLKYCFRKNIRCYCVPKISDIMIMSCEDIHLFDTSLLLFRNRGLSFEQQIFKRIFDIIISLIFLVFTSPIMLIIALSIKLYDRGPVFFKQDRLTKDGKVFKVYKFRSMRVARKGDEYCMTRKDDDRITPVGKFIRNVHFDELPQLINILKGDMSFVGPRPECPALAAEYEETIPEFSYRLKVKAGLTGYAQVYGKYNTTPYDKLKLDLTYILNYSILLDLKIIVLTFKVLFEKENTEGIESWQKNAAPDNNLKDNQKSDKTSKTNKK